MDTDPSLEMEILVEIGCVQMHARTDMPCSDILDFQEFLQRQELHGARRAVHVEKIQSDLERSLARTVPMAPGTKRLISKGLSKTNGDRV